MCVCVRACVCVSGGGSPSIQMLEAELRRLLAFVKSGYTNATHQESEWMQVRGLKLLATGARGLELLVCEALKGVLRAAELGVLIEP